MSEPKIKWIEGKCCSGNPNCQHKPTQPQQDPMEKLKHADGVDCQCHARSASECGCDADWTSGRVYELEAELADLRQVAQGLRADVVELTMHHRNALYLYEGEQKQNTTLQEQITKHSYAIGEWKKEEVLWKEREADLLAKLSVAREALKYYPDNCNHNPCDCLIARQALAPIEGTKE